MTDSLESAYSTIQKYVTNFELRFDLDRINDANAIAGELRHFYVSEYELAFSGEQKSTSDIIKMRIESVIQVMSKPDSIYVISKIPIFRDVKEIKNALRVDVYLERVYFAVYVFSRIFEVNEFEFMSRGRGNRFGYTTSFNEDYFIGPKTLSHIIGICAVDGLLRGDVEELIRGWRDLLGSAEANVGAFLLKMNSSLQVGESEINSVISKLTSESESAISEYKDKFENLSKLYIEQKNLESANNVWSAKAWAHHVVAWSAFSVFCALLISMLFSIYYFWPVLRLEVLEPLRTANGYFLPLLYSVPLVFFAWLLRVISRISMNSFVLYDDAALRKAQLDVYYRLVGDKRADLQPGDRLLILNALFRALPGAQVEDISPPTLADLAKEMFKSKS